MEKLCFVFPGQGMQFVQMGKTFYDNYEIAKETFEEASKVLDMNVAKLCFEGTFKELNDFTNMQIAIVTTEVAIYRTYVKNLGVEPQFLAGHSIGEYAALVCAGAIGFADCLKILKKRGELVQRIIDQGIGHMTIVEKISYDILKSILTGSEVAGKVFISCFNSNSQYAICGYEKEMEIVEEQIISVDANISPLMFSPPMHSPLMESIVDEYKIFLQSIDYQMFRKPIIDNITGKPFSKIEEIPEILSNHFINPVRWTDTMECMYKYGITSVVEMSQKQLVSGFIQENQPQIGTYCYGIMKESTSLEKMIKEDPNYVKDVPNLVGCCLAIIATTQNFNENLDEYKEVTDIYKWLLKAYSNQEGQNEESRNDMEIEAVQKTIRALLVKKYPMNQIKVLIRNLLEQVGYYYSMNTILERY